MNYTPRKSGALASFRTFRSNIFRDSKMSPGEQTAIAAEALKRWCGSEDGLTEQSFLTFAQKGNTLTVTAFTGDVLRITIGPKIFFDHIGPEDEAIPQRVAEADLLQKEDDDNFTLRTMKKYGGVAAFESFDDVIGGWVQPVFAPMLPEGTPIG